MTLVVRAPAGREPERRYILDVVLRSWLGLDYEVAIGEEPRTVIRMAGQPHGVELALPDVLFAMPDTAWLTERSLPPPAPVWVPSTSDGGPPAGRMLGPTGHHQAVPVLYADPADPRRLCLETPAGLALTVDLFGSVFFLLSRYEEIVSRARDEHGRFPGAASRAALGGYLERPVADEYVEVLWAALHRLWPGLSRRPVAYAPRLTHDVDFPWAVKGQPRRAVVRALVGDLIQRREPGLAVRRLRAAFDAREDRVDRDPFNTFDFLMDVSERHGIASTFYFMAGATNPAFDGDYDLRHPFIQALLRTVHDRGHHVGLHASYATCVSPSRLRHEFEVLRDACRLAGFEEPDVGVRQHFLRFVPGETWRHQSEARFSHDATLGFADLPGLRAGTCRDFPVFDLRARTALALVERPLVVMDATMFGHLRLGPDEATERAARIVGACREYGGTPVILYHNSTLASRRRRTQYADLVDQVTK